MSDVIPLNDGEWRPTEGQARYLQAALDCGLNRSVEVNAKAAGVGRTSAYRWLEDPNFRRALDELPKAALRLHMPGVVAAMVEKAQDGDVAAARLVFQIMGWLGNATALGNPQRPQQHQHLHIVPRADDLSKFEAICAAVDEQLKEEK